MGSPAFGVLFDPCNCAANGVDYRAAWEVFHERVVHVHLKDGRMRADGKWQRVHLGEGEIDAPWLLRELDRAGYSGDIALEYEVNEIEPPETGLPAGAPSARPSSLQRVGRSRVRLPTGRPPRSAVCDKLKIGINLMAWAGSVGPAELGLLPGIAALGYDGVELPIFAPEAVDVPAVRRALAAAGLACTVSTALPPPALPARPSDRPRRRSTTSTAAPRWRRGAGRRSLCGPLYAPVGALPGRPRNAAEWETCVAGLRAAGERAAGHGVILAVEVLNRFETHFLNTAGDAVALLDAVAHPAVRLHLDTFHMNVEEKRLPEALAVGMPHLAHVHAAENDRGSPGSGHVDWAGLREGLLQGGYGGWVVAETFTGTIPEIAAATAIWRPVVADGWTYAREAVAFLRHLFPPAPPA